MQVREMMTPDPAWCDPNTGLQEIGKLMIEFDCGEIPICDDNGRLLGVVTDRDIVCRTVAQGTNPLTAKARDCMSQPVVTVAVDATLEHAAMLMEEHKLRRLPVVDEKGLCCGILSQADVATFAPPAFAGEVVERISQPETGS